MNFKTYLPKKNPFVKYICAQGRSKDVFYKMHIVELCDNFIHKEFKEPPNFPILCHILSFPNISMLLKDKKQIKSQKNKEKNFNLYKSDATPCLPISKELTSKTTHSEDIQPINSNLVILSNNIPEKDVNLSKKSEQLNEKEYVEECEEEIDNISFPDPLILFNSMYGEK